MTLAFSFTWWHVAYLAAALFTFAVFEVHAALNGRTLERALTIALSAFWFLVVLVWGVTSVLAIADLLNRRRAKPETPTS